MVPTAAAAGAVAVVIVVRDLRRQVGELSDVVEAVLVHHTLQRAVHLREHNTSVSMGISLKLKHV